MALLEQVPTYKSVSAIRLRDFPILSCLRDVKVRESEEERVKPVKREIFEDGFLSRIISIEGGFFIIFFTIIFLNFNRIFYIK